MGYDFGISAFVNLSVVAVRLNSNDQCSVENRKCQGYVFYASKFPGQSLHILKSSLLLETSRVKKVAWGGFSRGFEIVYGVLSTRHLPNCQKNVSHLVIEAAQI